MDEERCIAVGSVQGPAGDTMDDNPNRPAYP
jgi:hypothetical protein